LVFARDGKADLGNPRIFEPDAYANVADELVGFPSSDGALKALARFSVRE
jgi:hypothetical protein